MFGLFCARESQVKAGWVEKPLDELYYSEEVTAAVVPGHEHGQEGCVYQQKEAKMSESSASAYHLSSYSLLPVGKKQEGKPLSGKSVKPIRACAFSHQTERR